MKRKYYGLAALFLLCFAFLFSGKIVSASAAQASVNKIAYVDASGNLVLKFADFCDEGYTYKAYAYNTTTKSFVSFAEDEVEAAKGSLSVSLKERNVYNANSQYKLILTGKDKKNKLTVYYYTGTALTSYTISQKSDNSLKAAWKSANTTTYSGYKLGLYATSDDVAPRVSVTAGAKDTSKSIAASKLSNMQYYVCLIAYKTIGDTTYYGQGLTKNYTYVKKPSKVTGLKAVPKANRAKLSWTAVSGASSYTIYKSTSAKKGFTAVKTNCTKTAFNVTGLTGGKKYYFKVVAVSRLGSKTKSGNASSVVSVTIPDVAGKTKGVKFTLDSSSQLALTWTKTKKATGYRIYYKKVNSLVWEKLGSTKKNIYNLSKLDTDTKYNLRVYAYTKVGSKKYLSSTPSKTVTVTPGVYMNKNYNKLLASQVRTITYLKNKCIYTTKKYSTEVKEAFVNYKGYTSKSKYLIWISHYTQQVSIFKGSKGKWKMIRTFICASGTAQNHSPRGTYKISYKEKGWFYTNTKELYVTHYCGRNSFHTRPLWNNGSVQNPTIGKPASHGCIRCYNKDAKYIYDKMPIGTTVVSY